MIQSAMLLPILSLLVMHPVPLESSLSGLPCCTGTDTLDQTTTYCMRCEQAVPSECASGELTKDSCGCCDVCAKAAAQECGGPWGGVGTCASHLYCDYPATPNFNYVGYCKQKNPTSDCCERKVVKETGEVYTLIVNSGEDALDVCLDSCVYRKGWRVRGITFCFKRGDQQVECV